MADHQTTKFNTAPNFLAIHAVSLFFRSMYTIYKWKTVNIHSVALPKSAEEAKYLRCNSLTIDDHFKLAISGRSNNIFGALIEAPPLYSNLTANISFIPSQTTRDIGWHTSINKDCKCACRHVRALWLSWCQVYVVVWYINFKIPQWTWPQTSVSLHGSRYAPSSAYGNSIWIIPWY